jgi:hypothetical protein
MMSRPRVSFRARSTPKHNVLTIWVNGAQMGNLTVRKEETVVLEIFIKALIENGASYIK